LFEKKRKGKRGRKNGVNRTDLLTAKKGGIWEGKRGKKKVVNCKDGDT